jgi:hypothetical protein
MKTQYLRAAGIGRIRCEGRFLKKGRSIQSLEARMWNQDGKLARSRPRPGKCCRGVILWTPVALWLQ